MPSAPSADLQLARLLSTVAFDARLRESQDKQPAAAIVSPPKADLLKSFLLYHPRVAPGGTHPEAEKTDRSNRTAPLRLFLPGQRSSFPDWTKHTRNLSSWST